MATKSSGGGGREPRGGKASTKKWALKKQRPTVIGDLSKLPNES